MSSGDDQSDLDVLELTRGMEESPPKHVAFKANKNLLQPRINEM